MKTLKELFKESKKEVSYSFYLKVVKQPLDYEKITRDKIYEQIMDAYYDDPEIILRMCSLEELNILKRLLEKNILKEESGYIESVLFHNLKSNYLAFESDKEYYLPKDLINPIKMAFNIFNEEEYSPKDFLDCVILGLIRIYNVVSLSDFIKYLENYNIYYDEAIFKDYLKNDLKNKEKIAIIKYKKIEYVISLENNYYRDIINLKNDDLNPYFYTLEEVISIGKYKINLFEQPIFKFLNFLEMHLTANYINLIIDDIILYAGFDVNNADILKKMADNIPELYQEMAKVVEYLPCWVYKGSSLHKLSQE